MSEATKYELHKGWLYELVGVVPNMSRPACIQDGARLVLASDYDTLRTANQRLEGEVAALRKDAERYRWICNAGFDAPSYPFIVINDFDSDKASIDSAIDAALAGKGNK